MSALRKQMEADMVLRGLTYRTRKSYLESVANFAKYYGRSPERITEAECESYLLHLLRERKFEYLGRSRITQKACSWNSVSKANRSSPCHPT